MSSEEHFNQVKEAVLAHIQSIFEEMEEAMIIQHQEKYTLLEDAFENANDVDELRIAFEQWHRDHADDIELEEEALDLWSAAMARLEDGEDFKGEKENDEGDDEEEEEEEITAFS